MNSRKPTFRVAAFAFFSLGLFLNSQVAAQVTGGTILGTVRDTSGATIAGAKVVIQNTGTGITIIVMTNEYGLYRGYNLIPGTYQVVVSASGFAALVEKDLAFDDEDEDLSFADHESYLVET